MALIKCPECGKEISDKASACPNCGCPNPNIQYFNDMKSKNCHTRENLGLIFGIVALIISVLCLGWTLFSWIGALFSGIDGATGSQCTAWIHIFLGMITGIISWDNCDKVKKELGIYTPKAKVGRGLAIAGWFVSATGMALCILEIVIESMTYIF